VEIEFFLGAISGTRQDKPPRDIESTSNILSFEGRMKFKTCMDVMDNKKE